MSVNIDKQKANKKGKSNEPKAEKKLLKILMVIFTINVFRRFKFSIN